MYKQELCSAASKMGQLDNCVSIHVLGYLGFVLFSTIYSSNFFVAEAEANKRTYCADNRQYKCHQEGPGVVVGRANDEANDCTVDHGTTSLCEIVQTLTSREFLFRRVTLPEGRVGCHGNAAGKAAENCAAIQH